MASFHRAGAERVNAFRVDDAYLFKHYFPDDVFARIRRYYDSYEYRFEVPSDRFEYVREFLEDRGFALVVVEDPATFAVVVRKYTRHPSVLFEKSVYQRSLGRFNGFVMKDREAVEEAVAAGARRLGETDIEHSL